MYQYAPNKVLIIDDCVDMRELLTFLLVSKGYSVDSTGNGEEAIELLNSGKLLPAVILLDLRMPVMDGFGFLNLQKESPRLKNIPVIMMTAENDIVGVRDRFKLQHVLSKPFNMTSVLDAVDRSKFLH